MIPFPDISPEIFTIDLDGLSLSLRWYALAYLAGLLENDPVRARPRPMPPRPLAAVTSAPPPRHVVPRVFAGGREDLASASGLHGAG